MTIVMWGAGTGAEMGVITPAKIYAEETVRGPAVTIVIQYVQTTVRIAVGMGARGAQGAVAPVIRSARGAVEPVKTYARGAETPALRVAWGARGVVTSVIRHASSPVSGAMGARGAQDAKIPAKTGAEIPAKTSAGTTVKAHVMAKLLRQSINHKIYHKIRRNAK